MHVFIGIIFTLCNSMRIKHQSVAYVCLSLCIGVCCIWMLGACMSIYIHDIYMCVHIRVRVQEKTMCVHIDIHIYIRICVQEKTMCDVFSCDIKRCNVLFVLKRKAWIDSWKAWVDSWVVFAWWKTYVLSNAVFSLFSTQHVRGVFFSFSSAVCNMCCFQRVQLLILRMLCTVTCKNTKNTMHLWIQCIFYFSSMKDAFFLDKACIVVCKHILFFMHEMCCNHAWSVLAYTRLFCICCFSTVACMMYACVWLCMHALCGRCIRLLVYLFCCWICCCGFCHCLIWRCWFCRYWVCCCWCCWLQCFSCWHCPWWWWLFCYVAWRVCGEVFFGIQVFCVC